MHREPQAAAYQEEQLWRTYPRPSLCQNRRPDGLRPQLPWQRAGLQAGSGFRAGVGQASEFLLLRVADLPALLHNASALYQFVCLSIALQGGA